MSDSTPLHRQSGVRYRTIVADPPWPYETTSPANPRCRVCGRLKYHDVGIRCGCVQPDFAANSYALPYATMTISEIAALPVREIAEDNAHLYLWTTQRFLWDVPDAFLDMVEQISPGPYVELFARRARFGWDYWGDQSLGTAEVAA